MKPKIPKWLLEMPSGSYSLRDFVEAKDHYRLSLAHQMKSTKRRPTSKSNMHETINRLKLEKIYGEIKGNLVQVKYIWNGENS
jgi:hypothetical protein